MSNDIGAQQAVETLPEHPLIIEYKGNPLVDIVAFPHIVERIADFADLPTSLRLRTTCRRLRDRTDKRLFQHVVLWVSGFSNRCYASTTDGRSARLPMTPIPTTPHPEAYDTWDTTHEPVSNTNSVVKYARIVDVMAPGLNPVMLPVLSSGTLVRTSSAFPLLPAPEVEERYLDTRYHTDQLQLYFPGPKRWVVHITFNDSWPYGPGDLIHITNNAKDSHDPMTLTLVLHPIDGAANVAEGGKTLDIFFPKALSGGSPIISGITVVGLEACGPELMGLPEATTAQVQAELERICPPSYPVSFLTMDEWAADTNAREVEVPEHMVRFISDLWVEPEEKYGLWDAHAYEGPANDEEELTHDDT
ncbi:hypothetical protein CspHIS471_0301950 [Cutaneotrichosporon sp. HIS471]|nr:hypothetical protein CspHIS471_0301950 [Cutaneotrichosporon sp. HIS471]